MFVLSGGTVKTPAVLAVKRYLQCFFPLFGLFFFFFNKKNSSALCIHVLHLSSFPCQAERLRGLR